MKTIKKSDLLSKIKEHRGALDSALELNMKIEVNYLKHKLMCYNAILENELKIYNLV